MNKITSNTLLPLSVVVGIGFGIFWVSQSQATIDENQRRIVALEIDQKEVVKDLGSRLNMIIDRLARIEGLLERKARKK